MFKKIMCRLGCHNYQSLPEPIQKQLFAKVMICQQHGKLGELFHLTSNLYCTHCKIPYMNGSDRAVAFKIANMPIDELEQRLKDESEES